MDVRRVVGLLGHPDEPSVDLSNRVGSQPIPTIAP